MCQTHAEQPWCRVSPRLQIRPAVKCKCSATNPRAVAGPADRICTCRSKVPCCMHRRINTQAGGRSSSPATENNRTPELPSLQAPKRLFRLLINILLKNTVVSPLGELCNFGCKHHEVQHMGLSSFMLKTVQPAHQQGKTSIVAGPYTNNSKTPGGGGQPQKAACAGHSAGWYCSAATDQQAMYRHHA